MLNFGLIFGPHSDSDWACCGWREYPYTLIIEHSEPNKIYKSMQTLALLGQRRFFQAVDRTLSITCQPLYRIPSTFYFLCTQTADNFPEKILEPKEQEEQPKCLSLRIERLPRREPVGSAFQRWMGEGFPIHRGDIFHAINRLRKLNLNKRALEVTLSLSVLLALHFKLICFGGLLRANLNAI